jgi:hypothetical protein
MQARVPARPPKHWRVYVVVAALAALLATRAQAVDARPISQADAQPGLRRATTITGVVRDARGPVAGANVRIKATEVKTAANHEGRFTLPWPTGKTPVTVTAWAPGYYVGWAEAAREGGPITIVVKPHYTGDNPDFEWFSHEGARGTVACSHCMPAYIEWQRDAHSRSAFNPRFLSMYTGSDLHGNQSPPTRFADDGTGRLVPLRPDPGQPYFGPGFKLDNPTTPGPCSACHVPTAAARRAGPYVDPTEARGVDRDGVSCEFCHKIGALALDPTTRLPRPDRPGVMSVRLFRPSAGEELFFGTFDDVTRRVSYLPLEEESAFCAPCHHGVFHGVTVYDSYGEWLASPYSDPVSGKTCQACHMPPAGYDTFVYPEKGGVRRDPARIRSHTMPGAASEELLRAALTMTATADASGDRLRVVVTLVNDRTGHHVPTDSPLRHLILLVRANDGRGRPLRQVEGPTVPAWGGQGDPAEGYFAGLPGKAFAKVLEELGTGVAPTGAYWNPTRVLSDTRLAAFATDRSTYLFDLEPGGAATVEVRLLFRRAFKELADLKKWPPADIEMAAERLTVGTPAR